MTRYVIQCIYQRFKTKPHIEQNKFKKFKHVSSELVHARVLKATPYTVMASFAHIVLYVKLQTSNRIKA